MSHVVRVELEVKDLDALERAAGRLRLELVRGQETFKWFGEFMDDSAVPEGMDPADYGKCQHAIRIPGNDDAYEVGVVARGDGTYSLVWDSFDRGLGLEGIVGQDCCLLKQAYAVEEARVQVEGMGFMVSETVHDDGTIRLECTR